MTSERIDEEMITNDLDVRQLDATDRAKVIGHTIGDIKDPKDIPAWVIYRQIDMTTAKNMLEIFYVDEEDAHAPVQETVDSFLVRTGLENYDKPHRLSDATSPLDLNCYRDCFIIFYLSPGWNWQFQTEGDCFTTKEDKGTKYSDLMYVMKGGKRIPGDKPPDEGCRLLYFRAKCKGTYPPDGFNLHIELVMTDFPKPGDKRRFKIIFDPDIRNPGGSA